MNPAAYGRGVEDWADNSDSVLCDINLFKTYIRRVFKNKAIPGQPTTSSGKPYKELYYNQAYVKVDNVDNMKDVQKSIQNLGLNASSNAEWIEQMQEQSRNIQLVLGGIGAVSLFVAAIGIANTMMMSIYERTRRSASSRCWAVRSRISEKCFSWRPDLSVFWAVSSAWCSVTSFRLSSILWRPGRAGIIIPRFLIFRRGWCCWQWDLPFWWVWWPDSSLAVRAMKLSPLAAIRNE